MRLAVIIAFALAGCSTVQPTAVPAVPGPVVVKVAPNPTIAQAARQQQPDVIVAIPCVVLTAPSYSVPRDGSGGRRWRAGTLADPKNKWDTPATVAQLRKLNAIILSVCGG